MERPSYPYSPGKTLQENYPPSPEICENFQTFSLETLFSQLESIRILQGILPEEEQLLLKRALSYLPEVQIPDKSFLTFNQLFSELEANLDLLLRQGFYPLEIARLRQIFSTLQENLEGVVFTSSRKQEPIPPLAQAAASLVGQNLREKIETHQLPKVAVLRKYLSEGYVEAVEKSYSGLLPQQKAVKAIYQPSEEVKQHEHPLLAAFLLPPSQADENIMKSVKHINSYLLKRSKELDKVLRPLYLTKHLLKDEFRILYFLLLFASPMIAGTKSLFESVSPVVGRAFPPIFADIITFLSQIVPTLEGSVPEKIKETFKALLTTHRKSFALSIIATFLGSASAEWLEHYNSALAGISYALIPFAVAMATTWDTIQKVRNQNGGMDLKEAIKLVFENNPIHLGIDLSAFLVFLTGTIAFGYLGGLENPLAVAVIEGLMEHPLGAALAKIITYLKEKRALEPRNSVVKKRINQFFS